MSRSKPTDYMVLVRIASQLAGMNWNDLTTCEKNICNHLIVHQLLHKDNGGNLSRDKVTKEKSNDKAI